MAKALRHFPLGATQKAVDITMLIITACAIDIPRIAMSITLAKQGRPAPRGPAQVFQFYKPAAPASAPPQAEAAKGASASPPDADAPHDASSDIDAIGGVPP